MEAKKLYEMRYTLRQIYKSKDLSALESNIINSLSKKDKKYISKTNFDQSSLTLVIHCTEDSDQKTLRSIISSAKNSILDFVADNKIEGLNTSNVCDAYTIGANITFLL